MNDTVDKLVIFLAKRDGIDKVVKTFQYVSKLVHWHAEIRSSGELADKAKKWEVASGLSRKAFRSGRFLTGFNALRSINPGLLAILSNAGEMVYFFFDHFLWLSRIGVLDPKLAPTMSFVSAFGEAFGYIFFIISDFILIRKGIMEEKTRVGESRERDNIRVDRVMRLMSVAANLADLVIAIADIHPNPFCNHALTLGISGLVSAWAGWYRNWPSS
ncbi:peroxisomal membrane protein 11-4-like [Henckelia pumila]|uniref:peroxisomal membrane protein 11-4-like n=1 Tax=Henckelia pumila TaxID=405737 RepID=UPI003C6E5959